MSESDPFEIGDSGDHHDPVITLDRPQETSGGSGSNILRNVLVGVGVVAAIGAIAIWRTLSAFGAPDASIQAMPAFTEMYANVDLKVFLEADIGRLGATFPDLFDDPDEAEQELLDDLAEPLDDQLGLDYETDVAPWIARSIGFGMWNIDSIANPDLLLGQEPEMLPEDQRLTMVVAIANRDPESAAAALQKVAENAELIPVSPIRGNAVWRLDSSDSLELDAAPELISETLNSWYLTVSGELGLMSNSVYGLETAMAVQAGEQPSLRGSESYLDTIALLPEGPGTVHGYGSPGLFQIYGDVLYGLAQETGSFGFDDSMFDAINGMATSFAINDAGFRFDIAYLADSMALEELGFGGFAMTAAENLTSRIPADALGYAASAYETDQSLLEMYEQTFNNMAADADFPSLREMIQEGEAMLFLPPGTLEDILDAMDPTFEFYIGSDVPSRDVPVEVAGFIGLNDPGKAADALDDVMRSIDYPGIRTTDDGWVVEDVFHVGVVDDVFFASSVGAPQIVGSSITDNERHQLASNALGTEHTWAFADLGAIFDYVVDHPDFEVSERDVAGWRPLTATAAGGAFSDSGAVFSAVILVDWVTPEI